MSDPERFKMYRLCPCEACEGTGKDMATLDPLRPRGGVERCSQCRGEGKVKQEVATAATPADVGLAIVQLGREGEWEGCQFGLLDSLGEVGQKWLIRPWEASPTARNVSDAGRVLRQAQTKGEK